MEGSWTVERARALTRWKLSESSLSPTSSLWLWPGVSFVVQPSQLEGCLTFFFWWGCIILASQASWDLPLPPSILKSSVCVGGFEGGHTDSTS